MLRPYLERLPVPSDASWSMLDRRLDDAIPFQWHHHPELELTLTLNSRGQRFIGDHVGSYEDPDLVLVGPNQPHTWSSIAKVDPAKPHVALVAWLRQDWAERLAAGTVEFRTIQSLLGRVGGGLQFSPATAANVRADFQSLFGRPPTERLLGLLDILNRIARDPEARPLASKPVPPDGIPYNRERIDRVLTHMHAHYAEPVRLQDLAEVAALSLSGLHRLFESHMRTTVSDYLTRLRIGDACARLSGTDQPIQHIAGEVGYPSLANFNRQFKQREAMTPREYRSQFRAGSGSNSPFSQRGRE